MEALDENIYKKALSCFPTGIALAATRPDPSGPVIAMTINSFASVSLQPPIILWCLEKKCRALADFADANIFTINVLAANEEHRAQRHTQFGSQHIDEADLTSARSGAPLIVEALAHFDCRLRQKIDMGDHLVLFADVVEFSCRNGDALCYFRSCYLPLSAG